MIGIDDICMAATEIGEVAKEGNISIPNFMGEGIGENVPFHEIAEVDGDLHADNGFMGEGAGENVPYHGIDEKLDDNGKPYKKDGEFLPNTTYELNGNIYKTDEQGRIIHVEGKVKTSDTPRSSLNSKNVEGADEGDDKGHIIAHVLGGSDEEGNLVPMDAKFNRGEYKKMESEAKKAAEEGKTVKMDVDVEYEGDTKRPKSFVVTLEIDGEVTVKKFLNKSNK